MFAAIGILMPLKDTTAVEGTKAVLETKISAQDISSVKWYHNDKLITPSDRVQMVAKGAKQRLVFGRTYASDEGHYKLMVGRADTSCRLSVQGKFILTNTYTELSLHYSSVTLMDHNLFPIHFRHNNHMLSLCFQMTYKNLILTD